MARRGLLFLLLGCTVVTTTSLNTHAVAIADAQANQSTDPRTFPLVHASDVSYLGSFAVPPIQGAAWATEEALTYGGWGLGISPRGLYWGGHDWHDQIAEISIPAIGETARILTPLTRVPSLSGIDPDDNPGSLVLGGTLIHNGRLLISAYVYYDANGNANRSHFVATPALTGFTGPYALGGDVPGVLGGYMSPIPREWQALFGGPALTGLCCIGIISRSSPGPALSVFDPDDVGVRNPVPTIQVLRYTLDNPLHRDFDKSGRSNPWYNLATQVTGVAFPAGTRTVIFAGRHGTGPYCYGTGAECDDPADSAKGVHAYPYQQQLWFYDARDLLDVKNRTKRAYEPRPYATVRLPTSSSRSSNAVTGAAWDPKTRRLYVADGAGDNPRVHVYEIGA